MIFGVLAIQGAIEEHEEALKKAGYEAKKVRNKEDLKDIDALIIPGGESTTIGKLMKKYGLFESIKNSSLPILGTCAGMVLLSKDSGYKQDLLGLMDITVKRNAYGRQRESFEKEIYFKDIGKIYGVFIRAPVVDKILSDDVEVIAKDDDKIVGVMQDRYMALSFHPELSEDGYKVYKYFVKHCVK
ncbi:glutamine amidotransferase subunit PdxT [Methanocaldococcus villosus KIN24-T80]|uniref:Pyridoxal 5'-phosphate synthase subunit PdxT n=1 Tax=Methanocaldococcus villosus KIN24-T80 TaxID=1069083 RepID=N6UV23_9EURY|nr:pyridoxal 5'-phosphate synthase glutaminase subunit PdxT [Methanocaldococcus villosus]ENN96214.1 glutamine amidotransferase subunit PdxT [Methanocaldococcus villosus KIN24-T80]